MKLVEIVTYANHIMKNVYRKNIWVLHLNYKLNGKKFTNGVASAVITWLLFGEFMAASSVKKFLHAPNMRKDDLSFFKESAK